MKHQASSQWERKLLENLLRIVNITAHFSCPVDLCKVEFKTHRTPSWFLLSDHFDHSLCDLHPQNNPVWCSLTLMVVHATHELWSQLTLNGLNQPRSAVSRVVDLTKNRKFNAKFRLSPPHVFCGVRKIFVNNSAGSMWIGFCWCWLIPTT